MSGKGEIGRGQCLFPVLAAMVLLALAAPVQAAVLGPNGKVVFSSDRNGGADLYETVPGGGFIFPPVGSASRLTHFGLSGNSASDPAWSPDGTKLAFVGTLSGNNDVYTVSQDGGFNLMQLTTDSNWDSDPAWSPTGSQIAFATSRDGNFNIYRMNANGTSQVPLTTNAARDGFPAWSPDGTKIAFESERDGNAEIYVMNADGSGQTNITNNAASDGAPTWSPDGTRIAFETNRLGGYDIATMNPNGSGVLTIQVPGSNELFPAWSPDGTKIAFHTDRDGNNEIYAMRTDGSNPERLTDDPGSDVTPDWQRSYDSPNRARELDLPIVPNFRQTISSTQCTARGGLNSSHGAPLALPSCNPPAFAPGTVAHLGRHASGHATIVRDRVTTFVSLNLSDVRSGSATGPDYNVSSTQDISIVFKLRITDQRNCRPAPCQAGVDHARDTMATVTDSDFSLPVNCVPTVDTTIGSSCMVSTDMNSASPNFIVPNEQTVIQLFRLRLNDAGVDGTLGNADDRAFAQQGLYVP